MNILVLANDMVADAGLAVGLATGNRMVQTASVDQALVLLAANDFDVIIVDFRPDLWGHQAVSKLRAARVELPILFVSARATEDAVQRAYDVGANDVLVLPVDHGQLAARVTALVQGAPAPAGSHGIRIARLEKVAPCDGLLVSNSAVVAGAHQAARSGKTGMPIARLHGKRRAGAPAPLSRAA